MVVSYEIEGLLVENSDGFELSNTCKRFILRGKLKY